MNLNTYPNYCGNCEQALRFYKKHFGAKITAHGDQPGPANVLPERKKAILIQKFERS